MLNPNANSHWNDTDDAIRGDEVMENLNHIEELIIALARNQDHFFSEITSEHLNKVNEVKAKFEELVPALRENISLVHSETGCWSENF